LIRTDSVEYNNSGAKMHLIRTDSVEYNNSGAKMHLIPQKTGKNPEKFETQVHSGTTGRKIPPFSGNEVYFGTTS